MSRVSVIAALLVALASCSKSKESAQKSAPNEGPALTGGVGDPAAASKDVAPTSAPPPGGSSTDNPAFHLQPSEGTLAIDVPADAKPGAETTAKITVTPADGYHVNLEYPTKLAFDAATGITVAKPTQTAGGSDKQKGDAETMSEQSLVFAVKLTPASAGDYKLTGSFKFAVCDKDQCLPKKESVTIQVAAK